MWNRRSGIWRRIWGIARDGGSLPGHSADHARKLAEQTEMALVVGEPGRERGLPDVGEAIDSQWVGNG